MSYESDECKLLIDEAIHDYLHDDTETEMTVKDWFYDLRKQAVKADEYEAKAKAYDSLKNKLENEVKILSGNVSGFPYVDAPIDRSISHFERILGMMKKLERGEPNAKK